MEVPLAIRFALLVPTISYASFLAGDWSGWAGDILRGSKLLFSYAIPPLQRAAPASAVRRRVAGASGPGGDGLRPSPSRSPSNAGPGSRQGSQLLWLSYGC